MELEFFCKPGTELEWFAYWKDYCKKWLLSLGIREEDLRLRDHEKEELSHYFQRDDRLRVYVPVRLGRALGRGVENRL